MAGLTRQLSLVWLCLLLSPSLGYRHYQSKIPNGDRVPDPAQANILWQGVGHLNAQGGGSRNVFGVDFKANNRGSDCKIGEMRVVGQPSPETWTKALCEKDSDSDGKTNGEELGDPDCTWTPGNPPPRNTDLSHPGICEPLDDAECEKKNEGIMFESAEPFSCPATKKPDVKVSEFRFARTEVPAEETNYYCKYFDLAIPENTTEHVIAFEPIIDNAEVMHHTLIYGCRAEQTAMYVNETAGGPGYSCRTSMVQCQEIVFLWTVGLNGHCHPDKYGGLLGVGGYTGIVIEHHWNNILKKSGMTDSSGVKLYHTPKLRPQNAAYLLLGPATLELPPGKEHILQPGGCGPACTSRFSHSIYVTQILPHMHYYGRAMTVTHNGKVILEQRDYNYDSPVIMSFDPPLEVHPGDDIGINCTFTTTSATEKTYFGLGTYDEMCLAITLVHPYDASIPTTCSFVDPDVGFCGGDLAGDLGACDMRMFFWTADWRTMLATLAMCDPAGIECLEGCAEAVHSVTDEYPCLRGKAAAMTRGILSQRNRQLVNYLTSCNKIVYDPYWTQDTCDGSACDDRSSSLHASVGVLILVASAMVI